ncbi:hypothetical protein D8674_007400 [Pyrus ussuriensis x Pyrus communis]|uniref:Uncharacterized protein n=1 Tax=Pyrus ussuriensis x Pyrus communis TaxID=2448454 RepID=A0A5N5HUF4_9ROSA|nr:hypothetical protein D8674_007400 [Pyrus ussuriensis x Pyrus communis]
MAKSQHSSKSRCFCKKIFSSPCPICKMAATAHVSAAQEESKTKEKMPPPTKVLVELSHTSASSEVEKKNPKVEAQLKKEKGTENLGDNDAFSDYISRTKIKIRAVSNMMDMIQKNEDDVKDTFSDYIYRAKMRKTSRIGSRKGISFKQE